MPDIADIATGLLAAAPIGAFGAALKIPQFYQRLIFPASFLATAVATAFVGGMILGSDGAYFAVNDYINYSQAEKVIDAVRASRPSGNWVWAGFGFMIYLCVLLCLPYLPIATRRSGTDQERH